MLNTLPHFRSNDIFYSVTLPNNVSMTNQGFAYDSNECILHAISDTHSYMDNVNKCHNTIFSVKDHVLLLSIQHYKIFLLHFKTPVNIQILCSQSQRPMKFIKNDAQFWLILLHSSCDLYVKGANFQYKILKTLSRSTSPTPSIFYLVILEYSLPTIYTQPEINFIFILIVIVLVFFIISSLIIAIVYIYKYKKIIVEDPLPNLSTTQDEQLI